MRWRCKITAHARAALRGAGALLKSAYQRGEIMRMYRVLLGTFWLALLAAGLTGCNTGKGVTDPATQFANLRIANFIPDASGPVNVTVDGQNLASGVGFEMVTAYQQIGSGLRPIEVSVAGTAGNVISTSATFTGVTNNSFLTYGSADDPLFLAIQDNYVDPGAGMFSIRAINAATGVKSVDVFVTAPGADLSIAAPNLAGVALGTTSVAIILPVGNYEIRVTSSGTKNVIYDTTPQSFAEHTEFEAVVYTKTSSTLVGMTLLNVDTTSTPVTKPNLMAQFKVVNGSSVPSPLNVFVNQDLLLSNIPSGGASSYLETLAGSPSLSVEATATPGAPLLTITPNLGPGTDTSVLFTGTAGALKALVLSDDNIQPVSDRARVRFVNGTTDVSALDVYVNFSKQISGLAQNSQSSGIEFSADPDAGTNYQIDFDVAGTSQPSLQLNAVTLFGGRVYSIYVVGTQGALSGIVTQDN
jgi:Domain of unknown function (DUF4397)